MAATNRKSPVKRAAANGHANGLLPLLVLTTSDEPEKRVPIFSIDGTEYTIPESPSASIGLQVTHLWATQGYSVATDWLLNELLGSDGYKALREFRQLTREQYKQVEAICIKAALGEDEDPKA